MMKESLWCEVSLTVPPDLGELAADILQEEGAGGVIFDDPELLNQVELAADESPGEEFAAGLPEEFGLRVYFPVDDRLGERLERLRDRLAAVLGGAPEFGLRQVKEEDWAESWKAYYKPERFGRIVIVPSWEQFEAAVDDIIIRLDPGMAFGTGGHPTTRLCLLALQELVKPGGSVLDLGTGSGILAVAAVKLGAGRVTASDIDPQAVRIAGENAARNDVSIELHQGDLLKEGFDGRFDLVVANIIADVILKLIPDVEKVLAPDGIFLVSGIILERAPEVRQSFAVNGFRLVQETEDGHWVAIIAKV
jgi:ribosomal protein L11 methyltransferase